MNSPIEILYGNMIGYGIRNDDAFRLFIQECRKDPFVPVFRGYPELQSELDNFGLFMEEEYQPSIVTRNEVNPFVEEMKERLVDGLKKRIAYQWAYRLFDGEVKYFYMDH